MQETAVNVEELVWGSETVADCREDRCHRQSRSFVVGQTPKHRPFQSPTRIVSSGRHPAVVVVAVFVVVIVVAAAQTKPAVFECC